MALRPHVKRPCSTASVARSGPTKKTRSGPTKKTKDSFDKFVTWVEVFDRLPKRLDKKKNVFFFDEEHKLALVMKRWDGEILGPERFHVFEDCGAVMPLA